MENSAKPQVPAKVPVQAGGAVAALIPQSLDEAFRVANAIALSGLAPRGLDKPEQVMVAIMAGAELGLAPFQSLQSIAVVNGRPTLWGDGLMAVARSQGIRAKEWIDGADDQMAAHCEVVRPDNDEVILRSFSVDDAKKAGLWNKQGPWQQYPKRMLQMRARAWALRDGCADMIRGFQVREEVEDYQEVREVKAPQGTGMRARLEARRTSGGFDPEHVEAELQAQAQEHTEEPTETEVETALPEMKTGSDLLKEQQEAESSAEAAEGEATEAEFEPAAQSDDDSFPGDRPARSATEQDVAGPDTSAPDSSDEEPAAFKRLDQPGEDDPRTWASDLTAELPDMDAKALKAALDDPKNTERFQALDRLFPQAAEALNAAISRRQGEHRKEARRG